MRKPRSPQGIYAALSPEQFAIIDRMLFEEERSYGYVVDAVQELFGVTTSESALLEYYKKRGISRLRARIAEAADASTVQAGGVEISITFQRPGEIRLAIRPLERQAEETAKTKS